MSKRPSFREYKITPKYYLERRGKIAEEHQRYIDEHKDRFDELLKLMTGVYNKDKSLHKNELMDRLTAQGLSREEASNLIFESCKLYVLAGEMGETYRLLTEKERDVMLSTEWF